jgi:hypothetical protein
MKITGYQVTNTDDSNVTKKMGLEKCLKFAYDNDETDWHHVERIKLNNKTQLVFTVQVKRGYIRSWCLKSVLTRHECRVLRKFAKEAKLKMIVNE